MQGDSTGQRQITFLQPQHLSALNQAGITYSFGQQSAIELVARLRVLDVATVAAMVVGIGVLATLQPAWKASRMDPIQALRHV